MPLTRFLYPGSRVERSLGRGARQVGGRVPGARGVDEGDEAGTLVQPLRMAGDS